MSPEKQQAHALIEQLDAGQLAAVVHLLQVMTDPVARAIANAPIDDEPLSDEGAEALDEARRWLETHAPIPNEEVLADFGLTSEHFERMGRTPLKPSGGQ